MIKTVLLPTVPKLHYFAAEVNRLAHEKGWYEGVRPLADQLFLAIGELAEAGEEYRSGHPLHHIYPQGAPEVTYNETLHLFGAKPVKIEGYPVELADCLIRLLDSAKERKIDIDDEVDTAWREMKDNIEKRIECPTGDLENDVLGPFQRALASYEESMSPLALLLEVSHTISFIRTFGDMTARELGYPKDHILADAERYGALFGQAIFGLFVVAACTGVDLMEAATLKHQFNMTRPHRHGNKLA